VKKNLYCSEFFYLNSNKKLLMWYKSEKNKNVLMWIVVGKNKKVKKIQWIVSSTILFCNKP
jgi:hypothetical protein